VRGARGWIAAAAGAIVIAAAIYLAQPHEDSPEHSSNSDAANGASAALLFAQAMGHKTEQMSGSFATPAPDGILFVFTPTSLYTRDEAETLRAWVREGGLLVYATEQGDEELDRAFEVSRFGGLVEGGHYAATPAVAGVATVAGGATVIPLEPAPQQVTLLRTRNGYSAGFVQRVGDGRVVVLGDPLVLCNRNLEHADNAILLADLLAATGPGATVTFDEYHHGLTVSDFAPQAWLTTPWGAALLWLLAAVFFGLLLRGRRFGPLVERPAEAARSDAEWSVAVGQLLRRSSARAVTLGLLAHATERAVAAQNGLPMQPRESFWNALWVRAPDVARELAEVEDSLPAAAVGERQLLRAARRLHRIAHPSPTSRTLRGAPPPPPRSSGMQG
jgi:uncharacterized protein DUF4350